MYYDNRVRSLFQKQISRTFPGPFQDSDWFFHDSKIHINPFTPIILMLILLTVCHTSHIFLLEFNRFPELSRTSSPFPGLSSPGKCHNKIPGLSRFSRTRTNPANWYIADLNSETLRFDQPGLQQGCEQMSQKILSKNTRECEYQGAIWRVCCPLRFPL